MHLCSWNYSSHVGGSLKSSSLSKRWTMIADSSRLFPVAFPSSSMSLSRWRQKNSGRSWGRMSTFTSWINPSIALWRITCNLHSSVCWLHAKIFQLQKINAWHYVLALITVPHCCSWPRGEQNAWLLWQGSSQLERGLALEKKLYYDSQVSPVHSQPVWCHGWTERKSDQCYMLTPSIMHQTEQLGRFGDRS